MARTRSRPAPSPRTRRRRPCCGWRSHRLCKPGSRRRAARGSTRSPQSRNPRSVRASAGSAPRTSCGAIGPCSFFSGRVGAPRATRQPCAPGRAGDPRRLLRSRAPRSRVPLSKSPNSPPKKPLRGPSAGFFRFSLGARGRRERFPHSGPDPLRADRHDADRRRGSGPNAAFRRAGVRFPGCGSRDSGLSRRNCAPDGSSWCQKARKSGHSTNIRRSWRPFPTMSDKPALSDIGLTRQTRRFLLSRLDQSAASC